MSLTYAREVLSRPSPNHAQRGGGRIDTVLLHHTASASDESALSWLCSPASKASAHYVVGTKGDVWQLVDEAHAAWHAGLGRMPWEKGDPYNFNRRSIGIEVVNPGDGKVPFPGVQMRSVAWLVAEVVKRHTIRWKSTGWPTLSGMSYVLGHRDVSGYRGKVDPADNFDWGVIRDALAGGGT